MKCVWVPYRWMVVEYKELYVSPITRPKGITSQNGKVAGLYLSSPLTNIIKEQRNKIRLSDNYDTTRATRNTWF